MFLNNLEKKSKEMNFLLENLDQNQRLSKVNANKMSPEFKEELAFQIIQMERQLKNFKEDHESFTLVRRLQQTSLH